MFISKKKYNEAIEKAKRETEERIWTHQRIGNVEEQINRRVNELEERVNKLEGKRNRKGNILPPMWRG